MFDKAQAIAIVMTKWHLIGALSYIIKNYNCNNDINIAIIIIPHYKDGYLIDDFKFGNFNRVSFHYIHDLPFSALYLIKLPLLLLNAVTTKNKYLDLIMPRNILLKTTLNILSINQLIENNIRFVCVDEGIGTYFSNEVWKKCSIMEGNHKLLNYLKLALVLLVKKATKAENWYLMSKKGLLAPNNEIAISYKEAILSIMDKKIIDPVFSDTMKASTNKIAIFLSQPWSENNQCTIEEELLIFKHVVSQLINNGYQVLLKYHPRENRDKYKSLEDLSYKTLSNNVPAEVYFSSLKACDIVVGYNSTALVTAKVIFNITAITILEMLNLNGKNNMMSQSLLEFKTLTSNMIITFDGDFNA